MIFLALELKLLQKFKERVRLHRLDLVLMKSWLYYEAVRKKCTVDCAGTQH